MFLSVTFTRKSRSRCSGIRGHLQPETPVIFAGIRIFWGLFHDAADRRRYIEYFMVESWVEHLRQHERTTVADLAVEARAKAFHVGSEPIVVTHWIAATDERDGAAHQDIPLIVT